jgi:hypothetical protein
MQYLSHWGLIRCVHDAVIGINFYSRQGIIVNKFMESNLLIVHKHDKKIYMVERFIIHLLWEKIFICLWVHAESRLDVGEKRIIFSNVTF